MQSMWRQVRRGGPNVLLPMITSIAEDAEQCAMNFVSPYKLVSDFFAEVDEILKKEGVL